VEQTLEALADYRLANDIVVVNDGEATLDCPYRRGRFAGREPAPRRWCFLDLKMPKVDGLAVPRTVKADPALKPSPS
jgi:CheY-like chemotaxis protein